ncbi:MAG: hypothetical protein JWO05_2271 [Gemmatimonadetes bacterium]|nr:hypothetical protein [Gemmatimonadota bacterium]
MVVGAALLLAAPRLNAQVPARAAQRWQTIDTRRFSLHHAPEHAEWTQALAERIDGVADAVEGVIGYRIPHRVQVVVDDPYNTSNGMALPFLDRPVITFWPTPPSPREDIGNYPRWDQMLASHEIAHLAHLMRPSRNAAVARFWSWSPVPLGPLSYKSPRWVIEGYATHIEGMVSGSGRPRNAWRSALLRQWALEGRLPTYESLNGASTFNGGDFAYLVGSAYLEWLADSVPTAPWLGGAPPDSNKLRMLWRRLSAREDRDFVSAFSGMFGAHPATLYQKFVTHLTHDAVDVERALAQQGAQPGELEARLAWATGDPAVSRDGARVALVVRSVGRLTRVVLWDSARTVEDTALTRARLKSLVQDPEDVLFSSPYPRPHKSLATLVARDGLPFEQPRFFSDGDRLLLSRLTLQRDGSYRPDLWEWNWRLRSTHRLTIGGALRDADPAPDGVHAVATQCVHGWCDLVMVELGDGAVRTLLRGSPVTSFHRPRFARDGRTIAVSVHVTDRWRIAVVDAATGAVRMADPADGFNRFDADFLPGDSALVATSERGAIANLERISLADGSVRPLSRVTGAAVGSATDARGAIWFLSLHSAGYDLRRMLPRDSVPHPELAGPGVESFVTRVHVGARDAGLPDTVPRGARLSERTYGIGPRVSRVVPGTTAGPDGAGLAINLSNVDPVGRLALLATAIGGNDGIERGVGLGATWRGLRAPVTLRATGWNQRRRRNSSVDADLRELSARVQLRRATDASTLFLDLVGGARNLHTAAHDTRTTVPLAAQASGVMRWSGDGWGAVGDAQLLAATGLDDARSRLGRARVGVSVTGVRALPFEAEFTLGSSRDSTGFAAMTAGGPDPILGEALLMAQRYDLPALPTGSLVGRDLLAWRASLPNRSFAPFAEGVSVTRRGARYDQWVRVVGMETNIFQGRFPLAGVPGLELRAGLARVLGGSVPAATRVYLHTRVTP